MGFVEVVNADMPRFDFSPISLSCKGLLIEEARKNQAINSNNFLAASWTTVQTVPLIPVAAQAISPDGTLNAFGLSDGAAAGTRALLITVPSDGAVSGTTYTVSCFFKKDTHRYVQLLGSSGSLGVNAFGNFDLELGVIGTAGTAVTGHGIEAYDDGWYRCSITAPAIGNSLALAVISTVNSATATRIQSYTGVNTQLFLYGFQFEAGGFPTSYIPTTTTALTRNADVATITGSNFTSFWNSVQGGTSAQATPSTVSGVRPLVQFDDGTANEIIALRGNTTNPELYIVDGGTPQAQLDAGTIAANTAYSLTGWWATNDCKARQDAGAVVTDTTATIPTVTQMRIGSDGTNYLNGTIATIDYYDSFFGRPIYTRRKNKVFASLL
jgi:hypothetical protein